MITVTPRAAKQIRKSYDQENAQETFLRIAARRQNDGEIEYGMGFDQQADDDIHTVSEGINILLSSVCKDLLIGAVLDYVELNPGEYRFIFVNPNDPNHKQPADSNAP